MKYYLIAGERSGDLHASNLMKELTILDKQSQFRFLGGEQMAEAGGVMYRHFGDISVMGFVEVALNLRKITRNISECAADIIADHPDVVILVDFSGFNMRVAAKIKAKAPHIAIHYYISPKIWVWNEKRGYKIKALIDHMYVIMPFEKDFYTKFDYKVDYVGNPILDAIAAFTPDPDFKTISKLNEKPVIAVLPGSRLQEVKAMVSQMTSVKNQFPDFQFVVAAVGNLPASLYDECRNEGITVLVDQTYDILHIAQAAIVTSGTATLETGLFNVPQVVCYKTSWVNEVVVRLFIKLKYFSLVNLIAGSEIVKELFQHFFTSENIVTELKKIAYDGPGRDKVLHSYSRMHQLMGDAGASKRTAELIIRYLA